MTEPDGKAMLRDARALLKGRRAQADDPYLIGAELLKGGDATGAAAAFERAIELVPTAPWPHVGLGDARRELRDPSGAAAAYTDALARTPGAATALRLTIAKSLEQVGALDAAEAVYRSYLSNATVAAADGPSPSEVDTSNPSGTAKPPDTTPTPREAVAGLARLLGQRARRAAHEAALLLDSIELAPEDGAAVESVLALTPRHPGLHRRFATVLADSGQTDRAIEMLRHSVALDPDDSASVLLLSELLLAEHPEALTVETADALVPLLDGLLDRVTPPQPVVAGTASQPVRGPDSATGDTIEVPPLIASSDGSADRADLLYRRARLLDAGRPALACVDAWRSVVEADPTRAIWHKELGDRLAELGRFEEAGVSYDSAVTLGYESF